ncbi:MAG: glycosyltransferase [Proteobacteria bacterium]|nr:glycosyltransferase [Pseudomonadota bacterium]
MTDSLGFQKRIQGVYQSLLNKQGKKVPKHERIKIDLHCHDYNSDVTDELLGRILRFPETWLKTEELIRNLEKNQCNAITITNHNNARSCWEVMEKGRDILAASEFTCYFAEYNTHLHVLAYGFSPEQEAKLNHYRRNLYHFLTYTVENNIPTILPHPLYMYRAKEQINPEIFEKLLLMFERFEVMNGQRDIWQNLLTWEWLNSITEEKIDTLQKKHGINSANFCKNSLIKHFTGGSDDHMGHFAGSCGSYLHVPNLSERQKNTPMSQLALEAIRNGDIHPYGSVANHQKLNIAFIDYFSQIALHMKEPGLIRMFLHQGSLKDKLICLGFSNMMQELRRHRFTMFFFKTLHEALKGQRPGILTRFKVSPDFKPLIREIDEIAKSKDRDQEQYFSLLKNSIPKMFTTLNRVIAKRIKDKSSQMEQIDLNADIDLSSLINKFEIPTHFRALFEGSHDRKMDDVSQVNLSEFLDTLSFPMLASAFIAGASLISTRVLMNQRKFVNNFAKSLGKHEHPERVLWLTDTLVDKNGVSSSLSAKLKFIRKNNLDIDFLICHDSMQDQPHLKVVRPVGRFAVPSYPDQTFHVPDILEIKKIFFQGGYDRIMCSTELLMGLVALYLKESMAVPVYFFLHTDWMEFVNKTTNLEPQVVDRIRRILRAFYLQFDGIFVMNQDHANWLTGPSIGYEAKKVHYTAHWVDEAFHPRKLNRTIVFDNKVEENDIVILYAGRISDEKGVFDLPVLMKDLEKDYPNVKLVVAGKGPAEERLKQQLPNAVFLGWVDKAKMPDIYSQVDMLILPSRFDTFGNVILEAMSCGTAVAAYDEKGPKAIIKTNKNGILAKDLDDLKQKLELFIRDSTFRLSLKQNSLKRANDYKPELIMEAFVKNIGLSGEDKLTASKSEQRRVQLLPEQIGKELKKAI